MFAHANLRKTALGARAAGKLSVIVDDYDKNPRLNSLAKLKCNYLSIIHFNCRSAKSFNNKFSQISAKINQYSTSLVCVTEK